MTRLLRMEKGLDSEKKKGYVIPFTCIDNHTMGCLHDKLETAYETL